MIAYYRLGAPLRLFIDASLKHGLGFYLKQQQFTDYSLTLEAVCDVFWSDGGPPFGSSDVNDFLKRWGIEWRPSSPRYPQGNSVAESAVKWAKSLFRKCWRGREQPLRTNEEWIKGILQWKNTHHESTGLSPAIMLYGHFVQDAILCHKSFLSQSWHDEKL